MRVDYIYKMIIQFDVYLFKINTIFKFFKNKIVNSRVPPRSSFSNCFNYNKIIMNDLFYFNNEWCNNNDFFFLKKKKKYQGTR